MLKVKELEAGYTNDLTQLHKISFEVAKGSFCTILGANGSGKTTLVRAVMGLLPTVKGEIWFNGKRAEEYSRKDFAQKVAVLSQEQPVTMNFTVEEIVQLGRYPFQKGILGKFETDTKQSIIEQCLEQTNTVSIRHRVFASLSGGERQRVLLAKALAQEPQLLFLDEPTNHLDIKHTLELLGVLKKQQEENGLTVVSILHDLNIASLFADHLLFIKKGGLIADGTVDLLYNTDMLKDIYDISLQVAVNPFTQKPQVFYG